MSIIEKKRIIRDYLVALLLHDSEEAEYLDRFFFGHFGHHILGERL